ncbi:unnamed protein product [Pelagomonas calceolata]|uniref:Uncharacterized protein n=1 Tax=Pelagomonas calceolata TaxID=35677 RepID=A0A8J2X316_9STRA|nr:unnamed protein product [Pelagomonas calceolata]
MADAHAGQPLGDAAAGQANAAAPTAPTAPTAQDVAALKVGHQTAVLESLENRVEAQDARSQRDELRHDNAVLRRQLADKLVGQIQSSRFAADVSQSQGAAEPPVAAAPVSGEPPLSSSGPALPPFCEDSTDSDLGNLLSGVFHKYVAKDTELVQADRHEKACAKVRYQDAAEYLKQHAIAVVKCGTTDAVLRIYRLQNPEATAIPQWLSLDMDAGTYQEHVSLFWRLVKCLGPRVLGNEVDLNELALAGLMTVSTRNRPSQEHCLSEKTLTSIVRAKGALEEAVLTTGDSVEDLISRKEGCPRETDDVGAGASRSRKKPRSTNPPTSCLPAAASTAATGRDTGKFDALRRELADEKRALALSKSELAKLKGVNTATDDALAG